MKFGFIDPTKLNGIDLSLPPDHPFTEATLKNLKKTEFQAFVGCAKWNQPPWIGKIYPPGSKSGDFLKLYGQRFNAVELNTMYYGFKDEKDLVDWNDKTPDDFTFCPKFLQAITHDNELRNIDELTDQFIAHFEPIRAKLGPYLLQLEDSFSPKQEGDLLAFAKRVSGTIPLAVELRNPAWFQSANQLPHPVFEKFREMGVSMVICDTPGRRDVLHQCLTTGTAFIRFNGNDLTPFSFKRLDDWVERIKQWKEAGLHQLYFFVHNDNEAYSPLLVAHFIEKLNAACGLSLTVPRLHPDQISLF